MSDDETLEKVEQHLYAAINDSATEMNDLAHGHVSKAYELLGRKHGEDGGNDEFGVDGDLNGSFVARDLYPDYDELHERIREHASGKYDAPGVDTTPGTWDIRYVGLEDGVVLYRVEHEKLGTPKEGIRG